MRKPCKRRRGRRYAISCTDAQWEAIVRCAARAAAGAPEGESAGAPLRGAVRFPPTSKDGSD